MVKNKQMSIARKIYILIIFLLIYPLSFNTSFASTEPPEILSPSCILIESTTGKIIYEKNSDQIMYPASTTKLMTAILTLENCNLEDKVTVSHNAVFSIPTGYSTASLYVDEEFTVEELLNVLLIPSANDAAIVLAEHIAGSVESFSSMMNSKAEEIGCKNTHFVNPNGIHDENHLSTAYDLALIGKYALQFPKIQEIALKTTYTLPATNKYDKEDRIFKNTNSLIRESDSTKQSNYYYPFATGLKTGYTVPAGYCVIASATKDNVTYIATILGGKKTEEEHLDERFLDCKTLFEFAFNNYSLKNIAKSGDIINSITVPHSASETQNLKIKVKDNINLLLPNDISTKSIEPSFNYSTNIDAPIKENTILGTVTYNIDGSTYTSEILSANTVERADFMPLIYRILLGILIILLSITTLIISNKKEK